MLTHWHCPKYGHQTFEDDLEVIYNDAEKLLEQLNDKSSEATVFNVEADAQLFLEDGFFYSLRYEEYDETVDETNVLNVSRLREVAFACKEATNAYFDSRNEQQLKEVTQFLKSEHDEEEITTPDRDTLLSTGE